MTYQAFEHLSDTARVWVYAFPRDLTDTERETVARHLQAFVDDWQSHGTPVNGAFELVDDRFVVLAAEATGDGISGCSIDSSVRVFKYFQSELNLDALDRGRIHYRENGTIHTLDRLHFKKRTTNGEIQPDTMVYDTTIETLGDLRAGRLTRPFRESWHARAFPLA